MYFSFGVGVAAMDGGKIASTNFHSVGSFVISMLGWADKSTLSINGDELYEPQRTDVNENGKAFDICQRNEEQLKQRNKRLVDERCNVI